MVTERTDGLAGCCGERPGRRERKKLEVLTRIRAAALELFNEKGYEATTVEEIADRADVAKATFFNYFPRKDTLLLALSDDMFGELLEELGPSEEWRGNAREQFQRLYLRLAEAVEQNPTLSQVMLIENMRNFWLQESEDRVEREFHAESSRSRSPWRLRRSCWRRCTSRRWWTGCVAARLRVSSGMT
jgi:TetR/AcrR family transcriptional regulator, cholesterol catabolism regulator